MNEQAIEAFWNAHPCGEALVGGASNFSDYDAFFRAYDDYRYSKEAHIKTCLNDIDFSAKDTLEVGLGQGADAEQIIRRGAAWSGVDVTAESIARVRTRLEIRGLPFRALTQGSILNLPFDENSFDIVFSHGVLHHVPEIGRAQREIHRVLRPGGRLVVMLYAKWSLNYLLSIALVRRIGLAGLLLFKVSPGEIYDQHIHNARQQGAMYFRMSNFIHRNTDGPLNPYSKVYDKKLVQRDFSLFEVRKIFKRFMHAPPLPIGSLPLEKYLGWHLWAHLVPKH